MTSLHIRFDKLRVLSSGSDQGDLPLSQFSNGDGHIHGLLEIEIDGRALPSMGFFGPDDVCFDDWVVQLSQARIRLLGARRVSYVFDEGEQGQPAFEFERCDDDLYISIVESGLSGAGPDPEWQRVHCRFEDFQQAVARFLGELYRHLAAQAPAAANTWWGERRLPPDAMPAL